MATSGVNVKMGVSGVAQFKQSMNQAKQATKTLDAQLALTEKQFKASGDAESYMAEKTELLKAKLEQQKSVVANAEKALEQMRSNGVDRASTAYQTMYQNMLKAKGELIDTENALNGVASAGEDAADKVSDTNSQLKRIGDGVNFENVTNGIGKITSGLEGAAKKAVNLGRKIFDAMTGAGSYADDLKTRASVYGLTTDQLQRMDKTANLIDTSVDSIINAQKKLRKGIGSADQGVMGAFAELLGDGYDPRKTGWEQAFWDAGEAIMKFTDEEEKEVYAQKLFGRSWNELIPLFEAGREQYDEMNASWNVLSDEQIESLAKMDDEYQKLKENVEELKLELLSEFAEPMASLMTTINEKVGQFSEWLESDEGKAAVADVIQKITDGLTWISDHSSEVATAIGVITTAFVGLKIAMLGVNVAKVVNGAKGLLGGGSGGGGTTGGTAAAAGGGWLTGISNKIAGFMPGVSSWVSVNGGPVWDWVTHESPLAGVINGMESWDDFLQRQKDKFSEESVQEFKNNWDPTNPDANVLAKAVDYILTGGNHDAFEEEDWEGDSYDLMNAIERMTDEIEEMNGDGAQSGNSLTSSDVSDFKGIPAAIEAAVRSAMKGIRIYMDGQEITSVVSAGIAGRVVAMTK